MRISVLNIFLLATVCNASSQHVIPFNIDETETLFVDGLSFHGEPISIELSLADFSTGRRNSSMGFRISPATRLWFQEDSIYNFYSMEEHMLGMGIYSRFLAQFESVTVLKNSLHRRGTLHLNATRDLFVENCRNGSIISIDLTPTGNGVVSSYFESRIQSQPVFSQFSHIISAIFEAPVNVYDFVVAQIHAQGCNNPTDSQHFIDCPDTDFLANLPHIHYEFVGSGTVVITPEDYLVFSRGVWMLRIKRQWVYTTQLPFNALALSHTNVRITHDRVELCDSGL